MQVLRLLQICGQDAAWPGQGRGLPTSPRERHSRTSGSNNFRHSGGGSPNEDSGDSDDLDDASALAGRVPPPLPVNEASARAAWSVLCASVLQKSMFNNVLVTRARTPEEAAAGQDPGTAQKPSWTTAAGQKPPPNNPGHYIWHVSHGLEQLLGHSADMLLGQDVSILYSPTTPMAMDVSAGGGSFSCATGSECAVGPSNGNGNGGGACGACDQACASASRQKELHEAVSAQRNCLIEVILPTADRVECCF